MEQQEVRSGITNRRIVASSGNADFYPTPLWATHALMENEIFEGDIWEPACGNGSMAEPLKSKGNRVFASDLFNRGYGQSDINFLNTDAIVDNIITNPPYNLAEEFAVNAYNKCNKKSALLLRLAFLEGSKRASGLFSKYPPARILVFSERITFYPEGLQTAGSGTIAYGWFVWEKGFKGTTELKWLMPGYKAKYK